VQREAQGQPALVEPHLPLPGQFPELPRGLQRHARRQLALEEQHLLQAVAHVDREGGAVHLEGVTGESDLAGPRQAAGFCAEARHILDPGEVAHQVRTGREVAAEILDRLPRFAARAARVGAPVLDADLGRVRRVGRAARALPQLHGELVCGQVRVSFEAQMLLLRTAAGVGKGWRGIA